MKNEADMRIKKIAFSAVGITVPFAIFLNVLLGPGILMVGTVIAAGFFLFREISLPLRKQKVGNYVVVLISITIIMVSAYFNYMRIVLAFSPSLEMVIIASIIMIMATIAAEVVALFVTINIMRPFP